MRSAFKALQAKLNGQSWAVQDLALKDQQNLAELTWKKEAKYTTVHSWLKDAFSKMKGSSPSFKVVVVRPVPAAPTPKVTVAPAAEPLPTPWNKSAGR
jgi:hypothetical protein